MITPWQRTIRSKFLPRWARKFLPVVGMGYPIRVSPSWKSTASPKVESFHITFALMADLFGLLSEFS